MTKTFLSEALSAGIDATGLDVAESMQTKILAYLTLLQKWNGVHNLTAVRDPKEMIPRHVLDSLVLLPILAQPTESSAGLAVPKPSIVDVGTGAGLPGLILAICLPDQKIVMLDSNQKKINFVQHVILSLKLSNAFAVCDRVEHFKPDERFDWVVSRAFASLSEFVRLSRHLCKNGGRLLAMKGAVDSSEIESVKAQTGASVERIEPVKVPGVAGARSLVFLTIQQSEA